MKYSFCRLRPNRWLGALAGILWLAAWDAGGASAQQSESLPLPQTVEQNVDESWSGSEDYEVLARGPVHEAFADPVGLDTEAAIVAPAPPPEPVQEQPPEARPTGENVIWIPGYWAWDDQESEYIYVSGLWRDVPPGRRWTPGYWHEVEGGYQWQPGFWIAETRQEVSYLPAPPETLEVGPNIAAPSEDYFWIPGCWQYAYDDYAWRPGFWSPIHSGWIWVPAHYVPTIYGYVYVDGYWDYEPGNRGLLYASVIFHRPVYTDPGYYYRPRYALGNTAALLVNLFFHSHHGMYYYGNYYSPYYYSRGFRPWYSPYGDRGYVSPIVSYYRWKYARRGVDFDDRMDLWKRRYESYGDDRRPRTFDPRQRASIASGIASPSGSNDLELISSMDSLISQRGSRYTRVDQDQRQRYESLSREIRSISDLRQRQDLDRVRRGEAPGDRRDGSDIPGRVSDSRVDRGRGNFTLPESYRMGRPNIDVDRERDRDRSRDGGRERDADRSRGTGRIEREMDGRAGRGIEGRRPESDSRRPGTGILAPGGELRTPDLDSRRSGSGIRTPGSDLRGPGSGLRIPRGDSPGSGSGIRTPSGDLRGPGSSLRSPGSSGRSGQGWNLRPPSIERGPSGRPGGDRPGGDRPGGDRSGGFNSRSQRGPEMGSSRSIRPGSGIGSPRRGSFSGDSGRGESRGRGNRGGDGNRGRNRDR